MPAPLPRRLTTCTACAVLLVGLLAGCGSSDPSGSGGTKTESSGSKLDFGPEGKVPTTPADDDGCRSPEEAKKLTEAPAVDAPAEAEASLRVYDDIPGCGAVVTKTSTVTVQYLLKSRSSGDVVDSSWKGGQPFTTPLGQGQVIPGWDHGIPGMREGGRRTLLLGPDEGYGAAGSPPAIAANDTLVFVIDLLSVGAPGSSATDTAPTTPPTPPVRTAPPAPPIPETPADAAGCRTPEVAQAEKTAPDPAAPTEDETSITVTDDIAGCGDLVEPTSTLSVQYVLKAKSTGQTVDSSWTRGQPFDVTLGQGQVIQGWDDALPGMRGGGRRTLVLGPDFAYGAQGRPPQVAANDTLLFTIDVLSVK